MHAKNTAAQAIDQKAAAIRKLARDIGTHPELGHSEHKACRWLTDALRSAGYAVTTGTAGMPTAFEARRGEGKPVIALLCEYDALPDIGHGCGHNLIGAASVGAALGLAAVLPPMAGEIRVIGAPAEETGGGKVRLTDAGGFSDVDAAMMFHPANACFLMSTSNAMDALEFAYRGRTAHAASGPERGINALDSVIHLFNGINALRQHVPADVRMHGIITEGGVAANIVPDRAAARFYFRAPTRTLLNDVVGKAKKIAEGAALMTGASLSVENYEDSNDNMVPNRVLALQFGENLRALGFTDIQESRTGTGSSDMGNVSQVVPAIHPYLPIGQFTGHSKEFAEGAVSDQAMETLLLAAKALAWTALDVLAQPNLAQAAKDEHQKALVKGQAIPSTAAE